MERRAIVRTNRWSSLVLVVALALLANYFGGKYWTSADWTAARFYSLSPRTIQELEKLDRPLRIVSLLSPDTGQVEERVFQELRATLLAFASVNPEQVTLEERDPLRDPAFAQAMIESSALSLERPLNVLIVEMGDRRRELALDEMVELDTTQALYGPAPVRALTLEGELLEAIVALSRERSPVIRFARGHGEISSSEPPGPTSYAAFVEALRSQDMRIESWNALGAEGAALPEETDLLVVAAPALPWGPTESAALGDYLERGGSLLLLVEALPDASGTRLSRTGLEDVLETLGVSLGDGLVLDPGAPILNFGAEVFYSLVLPGHPVGDAVADQALIFNVARPLRVSDELPEGVLAEMLVESSPDAWGEVDLESLAVGARKDASDETAPLSLAVALQAGPAEAESRVVVIGDASIATDETFSAYAHRPFLLGAVGWLVEDAPALGIAPKERNLTQLFLDADEQLHLVLLVLVALPALTVAAGVGTWWWRRRA